MLFCTCRLHVFFCLAPAGILQVSISLAWIFIFVFDLSALESASTLVLTMSPSFLVLFILTAYIAVPLTSFSLFHPVLSPLLKSSHVAYSEKRDFDVVNKTQ